MNKFSYLEDIPYSKALVNDGFGDDNILINKNLL